jgi:hypothetical protein
MFTTEFLKQTAERAIKSFAQGCITAIGLAEVGSLFDLSPEAVLGAGGLMALLSVLSSFATGVITGDRTDPSAVKS